VCYWIVEAALDASLAPIDRILPTCLASISPGQVDTPRSAGSRCQELLRSDDRAAGHHRSTENLRRSAGGLSSSPRGQVSERRLSRPRADAATPCSGRGSAVHRQGRQLGRAILSRLRSRDADRIRYGRGRRIASRPESRDGATVRAAAIGEDSGDLAEALQAIISGNANPQEKTTARLRAAISALDAWR
jgi:hypothetical protein